MGQTPGIRVQFNLFGSTTLLDCTIPVPVSFMVLQGPVEVLVAVVGGAVSSGPAPAVPAGGASDLRDPNRLVVLPPILVVLSLNPPPPPVMTQYTAQILLLH